MASLSVKVWLCERVEMCIGQQQSNKFNWRILQLSELVEFDRYWGEDVPAPMPPTHAILLFAKSTYYFLMANHLPQSAPSHLRWCGFEKEKSKIFISPDNHRFPLNLIYWIESVRWPIPLGVVSSSYPPQPRLKCLASSRIRSLAIKSTLLPIRSFLALFHHIARKGNLSLLGKEILRWI